MKAPFLLTAAIAPAMAARGSGAIVKIGSINGEIGMAGSAMCTSAKHAIHGLTKAWAAEFGPFGVRVNTVAPGPTLTARNEEIMEHLQGLVVAIPSGRLRPWPRSLRPWCSWPVTTPATSTARR